MTTYRTAPHVTPDGFLFVGLASDPRYHYWAGGQSLSLTMIELGVAEDLWRRYSDWPYLDCPEFHGLEE